VRSNAYSGVVVAYEADDLDPQRRLGWSVVVTGLATTVTEPERVARYSQQLRPWVNKVMDTVIAIEPEIVTGIRIVADGRASRA
jgi:Pyridoxamine 5'-phosphate oxidase